MSDAKKYHSVWRSPYTTRSVVFWSSGHGKQAGECVRKLGGMQQAIDDAIGDAFGSSDEEEQVVVGQNAAAAVPDAVLAQDDTDSSDEEGGSAAQDSDSDSEGAAPAPVAPRKRARAKPAKKTKRKAKKPRSGIANYLDQEAMEDEDEDSSQWRSRTDQQEAEAARVAADRIREEYEGRKRGALETKSAHEIAAGYERRSKESGYTERAVVEEGPTGGLVAQQAELPSVHDPKLWMIRVKAGQEMEIMIALTNKFFAKAAAGQPLRIYSVVRTAKEHVYVEAENEADVQQAIQGIPDVYGWRPGSIKLIPVGEMTSVVSVPKRNQDLTRGAWVRFKRGAYKGDLAQVRDVLDGGARVLLMAVPRLDLSLLATPAHKRAVTGRARRRPPQRLFSAEEVKAALEAAGPGGSRSSVEPARHRSLNVEGHRFKNAFYADGFMLKEMKTAYVDAKDPQPTLAELNMFKPASGSSGLLGGSAGDAQEWERTLAQSLTTAFKRSQGPRAALLPGDRVAVVAGALEGVTGRVVSVNEAAETFMLDLDPSLAEQAGIHEHLEESLSNAIKVFEVGDHVKVVGGLHTGATGTVYFAHSGDQGTEHTAVIRLDTGMDQVQVFFRDLILSAERMADTESLEGHRKFDLVEVRTEATQQPQVGIVVGIQHRSLLIVDQMDRAHTVPVNMVRRNLSSSARRERALGDKERHIEAGTIVKVLRGKHKGLEATVKYVYRSRLFLHSNKVPEHAGCFALASRQVVVPGPVAGSASSFGRVLDGVPGAVGAVAGAASRKAKQRVDDEYRGKTVRVLKGLHRQKLGRVKQTLPDRVKVELHSTQKVITLQRSEVKVVEDESIKMQAMGGAAHGVPHGAGVSAAHQYGALPGGMTPAAGGGATPAYGSGATPAFGGGATPAYGGGATPAYGGGATPAYGGGATPAYGGGATPAYGGGATPAYGGGATPAYGGGATPAYSGGATPAYGGGATPAYSGGATPAYPGSDAAPASGQHQGTASSEQQEAQQAPAHCVPLATVTVSQGPRAGELAVVQRVQGADVLLRSTGVGGAAVSSFTILGSDTKPVAPTQKQERAFVFGGGHTGPGEVQDIADGEVVLSLDNGQVADVRLADVVLLGAE